MEVSLADAMRIGRIERCRTWRLKLGSWCVVVGSVLDRRCCGVGSMVWARLCFTDKEGTQSAPGSSRPMGTARTRLPSLQDNQTLRDVALHSLAQLLRAFPPTHTPPQVDPSLRRVLFAAVTKIVLQVRFESIRSQQDLSVGVYLPRRQ